MLSQQARGSPRHCSARRTSLPQAVKRVVEFKTGHSFNYPLSAAVEDKVVPADVDRMSNIKAMRRSYNQQNPAYAGFCWLSFFKDALGWRFY
jgi:hypothetical protein